jgi:hypothetical protein
LGRFGPVGLLAVLSVVGVAAVADEAVGAAVGDSNRPVVTTGIALKELFETRLG